MEEHEQQVAPKEPEPGVERLRQERDEAHERWLRTAADFDNYRKRARREAEADASEVRANVLRSMLPIADNLERALQHAVEGDPVAAGVLLVHQQLVSVLEKHGVARCFPIGEPFDPRRHDAIDQVESTEIPPGTVTHVLVPGYLIDGRLLRPAQVTVSKQPPVAAVAPEGDPPD